MIKVITPVTVEPLTLYEAKAHLRVDFSDDDLYIESLISAARDYAEGYQKRSLGAQTLEYICNSFQPSFRLSRPPLVSVQSVKYTDHTGTEYTVLPETYYFNPDTEFLMPAYGCTWPSSTLAPSGAVRIRYTAGYTPDTLPKRTKQALLLMIGHWYENREAVVIGKTPEKLPLGVEPLLWMDRSW